MSELNGSDWIGGRWGSNLATSSELCDDDEYAGIKGFFRAFRRSEGASRQSVRELDDGYWKTMLAYPYAWAAVFLAASALGIKGNIPHDPSSAKIPSGVPELTGQPGQREDGRTFVVTKGADEEVNIRCSDGLPPANLGVIGEQVIVFCKGDNPPPPNPGS